MFDSTALTMEKCLRQVIHPISSGLVGEENLDFPCPWKSRWRNPMESLARGIPLVTRRAFEYYIPAWSNLFPLSVFIVNVVKFLMLIFFLRLAWKNETMIDSKLQDLL